MDINHYLGWAASVSSIVYLCLGLPSQIVKNVKNRSTRGLSLFLVIFMAISIALWCSYAWTKRPRDWFILASNAPGLLFSLVLFAQFWVYRNR